MTKRPGDSDARNITIERTYSAPIGDLWDLWTTKDGIESWGGPGGFAVEVRKLDLRPGGHMVYVMTATDPAQVQFMRDAGMAVATEARLTYSEIIVNRRLAYTTRPDFIPDVEPYDVATVVEFHESGPNVRMVLTLEPMHDEEWTQRAVAGMEGQLEKLGRILPSKQTAGR